MKFCALCCCQWTSEPTSSTTTAVNNNNDSPNVIDVYIEPEEKFQFPISRQPRPRQPNQNEKTKGMILMNYETEPKAFRNFAYVDEIDISHPNLPTNSNKNLVNSNKNLVNSVNSANSVISNDQKQEITVAEVPTISKLVVEEERMTVSDNKAAEAQAKVANAAAAIAANAVEIAAAAIKATTNQYQSNDSCKNNPDIESLLSSNHPSNTNFRTGFSTSYSIEPSRNLCTVNVFQNGVKTVRTLNIDDISLYHNEQFYRDVRLNAEKLAQSVREQFQTPPVTQQNSIEMNCDHMIANISNIYDLSTKTIVKTPAPFTRTANSVGINVNISPGRTNITCEGTRIHINNQKSVLVPPQPITRTIFQTAFDDFIKESHLTPHLPAIQPSIPTQYYAISKIHEDPMLMPTIRPAKKHKFPNAFDEKLIKATDLKRKPNTNAAETMKSNLCDENASEYRYASFRLATLDAHNYFRLKHGCAALVESPELNEVAQDWANNLAKTTSELYHRPKNRFGENLFWTDNPSCPGLKAVQSWYNEIELYDYKNPGFSAEVGHFTQLIWTDTKEMGTGIARVGNMHWVVCNYNPPGNVMGKFDDLHVPRLQY